MAAPIFTTEQDEYEQRITRVRLGGHRVGTIIPAGEKTFRASRKYGEVGVDIRRVAWGFRSFDAALAWVCKQSPAAEVHASAAAICAGPGPGALVASAAEKAVIEILTEDEFYGLSDAQVVHLVRALRPYLREDT